MLKLVPLLLVVPAVAYAEPAPRDTYVALDGQVVVGKLVDDGIGVEAGRQLSNSPLYLHGAVAAGHSRQDLFDARTGQFAEARVGVELDQCTSGHRVCAFEGADVGLLHEAYRDDTMSMWSDTPMLLARGGVEVGGKVTRLRTEVAVSPERIAQLQLALALHF